MNYTNSHQQSIMLPEHNDHTPLLALLCTSPEIQRLPVFNTSEVNRQNHHNIVCHARDIILTVDYSTHSGLKYINKEAVLEISNKIPYCTTLRGGDT